MSIQMVKGYTIYIPQKSLISVWNQSQPELFQIWIKHFKYDQFGTHTDVHENARRVYKKAHFCKEKCAVAKICE